MASQPSGLPRQVTFAHLLRRCTCPSLAVLCHLVICDSEKTLIYPSKQAASISVFSNCAHHLIANTLQSLEHDVTISIDQVLMCCFQTLLNLAPTLILPVLAPCNDLCTDFTVHPSSVGMRDQSRLCACRICFDVALFGPLNPQSHILSSHCTHVTMNRLQIHHNFKAIGKNMNCFAGARQRIFICQHFVIINLLILYFSFFGNKLFFLQSPCLLHRIGASSAAVSSAAGASSAPGVSSAGPS